MPDQAFRPGDLVIYTMPKRSRHPGPRARSIHPAQRGDDYSYIVDKYWVVVEVIGTLVYLRTRRGKTHSVPFDDPLLRRANWWERWRHRDRFPDPNSSGDVPIDEVRQTSDSYAPHDE